MQQANLAERDWFEQNVFKSPTSIQKGIPLLIYRPYFSAVEQQYINYVFSFSLGSSFKRKAGTSDWIFQSSQSFKTFQKLPLSWLPLLLQKPLILLCSSALKLGNTPFRTFWFIPILLRVEKYFSLKVSIFISVKKVSAYMTWRPVSTPYIWHYGNYNLHFKVWIAR